MFTEEQLAALKGPKGDTGPAGATVASGVSYDDTITGLNATDVQSAIEALADDGTSSEVVQEMIDYTFDNDIRTKTKPELSWLALMRNTDADQYSTYDTYFQSDSFTYNLNRDYITDDNIRLEMVKQAPAGTVFSNSSDNYVFVNLGYAGGSPAAIVIDKDGEYVKTIQGGIDLVTVKISKTGEYGQIYKLNDSNFILAPYNNSLATNPFGLFFKKFINKDLIKRIEALENNPGGLTEEQVNALIDSKLQEVENGTY